MSGPQGPVDATPKLAVTMASPARVASEIRAALPPDGGLAVQTAGGERYTRNGALQISSTGALAQLLCETEFTVLFHQGNKESIHVSTVDDQAILLAIFGERTTVGMVRLFAKEAATAVGQLLAEARAKPRNRGALSTPLTADESRTSFGEPKKS